MLIDFVFAAVAALAQGEPTPQQEKKAEVRAPSEDELESKVLELGVKHFKAPQDENIQSELALAQYALASLRWASAEEQLKKDNGVFSKALQDRYAAARDAADLALTLTFKSAKASTQEIDERIGRCHLIMGAAYLRESDSAKGLDSLRKGFSWGNETTKKAIATEIVSHYLGTTGIQNIVTEFTPKSPALKEALLETVYQWEIQLSKQEKTHTLTMKGKEIARVSLLYGALTSHVAAQEQQKPAEERDSSFARTFFFMRHTITYAAIEEKDKNLVVERIKKEYPALKKVFPTLGSPKEEYAHWSEKQEKSKVNLPGMIELREALKKQADY